MLFPPCKRPAGMTMIELLAVMAVLGVLIALIFPEFKKITEKSNAAKCVGNLRNFGVAHQVFMAESGYVLPYKHWTRREEPETGSIGGRTWYSIIAEEGVGESKAAHTCLAAKRRYETTSAGKLYGWANYGWNASIEYFTDKLLRPANVQKPSKLFLAADATDEAEDASSWLIQISTTPQDRLNQGRKNQFAYRHNGRANVLFMDGHVAALPPEEIPLRTSPRTREYNEFWEGVVP